MRPAHLLTDPRARTERVAALPLLLRRGAEMRILPEEDIALAIGDRILFGGNRQAMRLMRWTLFDAPVLRYVRSGEEGPRGAVWRWLRGAR